ncbi:MAG TPA: hypothetical protein VFD70_29145 [Anaerolineae bacterium]|nr:hypothetical protein [Anaerolineae bacterium]
MKTPEAKAPEPPMTSEALPISPEAAKELEPLKLPRGAFLAMRKNGATDTERRELVVYPDGRVAYDVRGVPQKEYNQLRRTLNDAQILALRKLLDQTGFWKAEVDETPSAQESSYEITARLGQRSNSIKLFEASVPERLAPLVERLTKLLPE